MDGYRVFVEFEDGTYVSTLCEDFNDELSSIIEDGAHGDVVCLEIRGPEDWIQKGIPSNPRMPDLPEGVSYKGFKGSVDVEVGFCESPGVRSTCHEIDCRCAGCCPKTPEDAARRLYDTAVEQYREGAGGDRIHPGDVIDALAFALGQPNTTDLDLISLTRRGG